MKNYPIEPGHLLSKINPTNYTKLKDETDHSIPGDAKKILTNFNFVYGNITKKQLFSYKWALLYDGVLMLVDLTPVKISCTVRWAIINYYEFTS